MLSKPLHLYCDLLRSINKEKINSKKPKFSWALSDTDNNSTQLKYHVVVSCELESIQTAVGDEWDSTVVNSHESLNIPYQGAELKANQQYFWRVRVWNNKSAISPWSDIQTFKTGNFTINDDKPEIHLVKSENKPVDFCKIGLNHYFVAFEKAVFGTVRIEVTADADNSKMIVHLGEDSINGKEVNKAPLGTIRYKKIEVDLKKGQHLYTVEIPPDKRNTGNCAILMPSEIGEVFPFRFCEIENCPSALDQSQITQIMVHHPFDDEASDFKSSDEILNQVWDICKYTIKATSFCGIYVDGDRERIPYEADAYINQLCHYCVDNDYLMARRSHEFLMKHPTWPTEWILHSIMMAWADYTFTGNKDSLHNYYTDLKAKSLLVLKREDGLISTMTGLVNDQVLQSIYLFDKNNPMITSTLKDIVDWPPGSFATDGTGERDNYEMKEINTVVNAFHCYGLLLLNKIAKILDQTEDAKFFEKQSEIVKNTINTKFFDKKLGLYKDGEGTDHVSLHGNMIPLAFGLVPAEYKKGISAYLQSRGMVCSVYGAQYLLEALYQNGGADYALKLMVDQGNRGWYNMLKSGATMTMEAWDIKYKKNLDWNHAWGAVPGNIIPMYLMGIRPLDAGFATVIIQPQISSLEHASIKFPTMRGPIVLKIKHVNKLLNYEIILPANMQAEVHFPRTKNIQHNHQIATGMVANGATIIKIGSGYHLINEL
jgi:hypothetical protein